MACITKKAARAYACKRLSLETMTHHYDSPEPDQACDAIVYVNGADEESKHVVQEA